MDIAMLIEFHLSPIEIPELVDAPGYTLPGGSNV